MEALQNMPLVERKNIMNNALIGNEGSNTHKPYQQPEEEEDMDMS